ncbi:uncharacterized protein LOC126316451 [Schistocerca gregaria]|uniref:uncharacterized protein LOC126316451 n=1 Tax=Schistocerca gregaria TaxID=7010 RepID=UPI00211EAF02|nr:uncharacterized protein LOC126316451 [Schistocerca gregaria]
MNSKQLELAKNLRTWAVDTMHYQTLREHPEDPIPGIQDFQNLCRGSTMDIWEFIIRHVAPESYVKAEKRRLSAAERKERARSEQAELSRLSDRSRFLELELDSRRREAEQARSRLSGLYRELAEAERQNETVKQGVEEQWTKSVILDGFYGKFRRKLAVFSEYRHELEVHVSRFRRGLAEGVCFAERLGEGVALARGVLEEEEGYIVAGSLSVGVEGLVGEFERAPVEWRASLVRLVEDEVLGLESKRVSLCERVAEKGTRFPLEIEESLLRFEESHVGSFIEGQRAENEYEAVRRRVEQVLEMRGASRGLHEEGLGEMFGDGQMNLVSRLQELERELEAEQAEAEVSKKAILCLIDQKSRLEREASALKREKQRLRQLRAENQACWSRIVRRVIQRMGFPTEFESRARSVRNFCRNHLTGFWYECDMGEAERSVRAELELFKELRLWPESSDMDDILVRVLEELELPPCKGPGGVVDKVAEVLCELARAETEAKLNRCEGEEYVQGVEDRPTDGRDEDASCSALCAKLEENIDAARNREEICTLVKEACDALWSQRAQDFAPWVRVDGKTLEEWKADLCAYGRGG